MKIKNYLLISVLLATLKGCALQQMVKASKDQSIELYPNPVFMSNDSIRFNISVTVPTKILDFKGNYFINVSIESAEKELAILDPIQINSLNEDAIQAKFTKLYAIPYDPLFDGASVIIQGVLIKNRKQAKTDKAHLGNITFNSN